MYVFIRSMSSNEDPAATRDQEVKEPEEVEVGGRPLEVGEQVAVGAGDEGGEPVAVGEGDGGGEHVAVGGGDETTPSSYPDLAVAGMTPGQALAAVERGSLTVHQMQRLLGGPGLTSRGLLRELLLTKAAAEANAVEVAAAVANAVAVAEAKAASEQAAAVAVAVAAAVANAVSVAGAAADEAKAVAEAKAAPV